VSNAADMLRTQIIKLVGEYYKVAFPTHKFRPGESSIPYAGRVFDDGELVNLVESALDFWLTSGRFARQFEQEFAQFFGTRHALLVNSGSSANLLALSCLTSPKLGKQRLYPGDEVITVAAGFPTTVNPIVQCRLIPVFVDVMNQVFWIGVYPGLSQRMLEYILNCFHGIPRELKCVAS